MTPRWERAPAPPHMDGALLMDAVLRPHRSLSAAAFKLMLIVVIVINAVVAAVFLAQGAFPVAGFLGLDVLALWIAFRVNYRAAQREEHVRVSRDHVHVASIDPKGQTTHWVLNPLWARVGSDGRGVLIRAGRDQMRVGTFMGPNECASFASALSGALRKARGG